VLLNPYIKNWQIWACPSTSGNFGCSNGSSHYIAVNAAITAGAVPATFSCNYEPTENFNINGPKMALYKQPSQTYLIGDCSAFPRKGDVAWANVCAADCNADRRTDDNTVHNGGSNIAYMDGHTKWQNANTIFTSADLLWP
jgi:prepilin-type processing-associated H-X9-DG protein